MLRFAPGCATFCLRVAPTKRHISRNVMRDPSPREDNAITFPLNLHSMEFEWAPEKNEVNLRKHGIDFEGAKSIWDGRVVEVQSPQRHRGEIRYLAIGLYQGREIAVVYTMRGEHIRIISARRARKNERDFYWQNQG